MNMPEQLKALLRERFVKTDTTYWAGQYEAAVGRVTEHSDGQGGYWSDSEVETSSYPGVVLTLNCAEITPEQAEAQAWELLVLADLARMETTS